MQQGSTQPQHQPADGPAFWNITLDLNPGELESDLCKMFFNQALDLHKENEALKQRIKRLEEVGDRMFNIGKHIVHQSGEDMYWIRKLEEELTEWTAAKESKP